MAHRHTLTLFAWFRRAAALRVVLVVGALLASQNSLVCAFEEAFVAQGTEIVALDVAGASAGESGENCCALCLDCANCGGCHSSASNPRPGDAHLLFRSPLYAKFTVDTAAPELWTPPAVLRPPIDAA
jgi:mono/diheme cytochrome c family protein